MKGEGVRNTSSTTLGLVLMIKWLEIGSEMRILQNKKFCN